MWVAIPVTAETLRVATFAAPLSRDGPGLLLRDLIGGDDPQIAAIVAIINHVAPDILVLTDFDYDADGLALAAFANALRPPYPHLFAARPNTGMATGLDLDQNGRTGDARDAQGYGRFAGDGGMAILSRWPIDDRNVQDLSAILWRDVPDAQLPQTSDGPFLTEEVAAIQRLSTSGHWIVPVVLPNGSPLHIMAFSATPPVFDGPEDHNGLRNADELLLWVHVLDGRYGKAPDDFVIVGNANLDPVDGQGFSAVMANFLADPRLQDPVPRSMGGQAAADPDHSGDPGLDTADWPDNPPGNLRVSYILPATTWQVAVSGVFWPAPVDLLADLLGEDGLATGPHRLVWVDLIR